MTSDEKNTAKLEKKREKLEAKIAKKQVAAESSTSQASSAQSGSASQSQNANGISPAERSARAAERQVRLQSLRVLFALIGLLLTATMLMWTIRPWEKTSQTPDSASPTPTVEPSQEQPAAE